MKNALFTLVKSMLRGEKRAFNLTTQRYTKSKEPATFSLYKILETEKLENKSRIENKFFKEQQSHNLPVTTNQLFVQLLQSLREQAGKNRHDFAISKYLDNAKILFNRGIFKEGYHQVQKAKKLALEMDYIEMMPAILSQENRLQQRLLNAKSYYDYKNAYHQEYKEVLKKLENILEYIELTDQIYALYRKHGVAKDQDQRELFSQFFNSHLLKKESAALSLKAQVRYHIIQNLLFVILNNIDKADFHISRLLKLYETNKNYLRHNLDSYLSVMNNSLFTWSAKKEYDKFFEGIKKVRGLDKDYPDLEIYYQQRVFETTYSLELEYCIVNKNFERGEEIVKEIEIGLKRFPSSGITIDRILGLSLGNAFLFFKAKKYEESLDWVNKILKYERGSTAIHLIGYAKVLHIMIHLSQRNYNYVQNIDSTFRKWLKKKALLSDLTVLILNFIKKYPANSPNKEKKNYIRNFKEKAAEIPKDHILITHYDIKTWVKDLDKD